MTSVRWTHQAREDIARIRRFLKTPQRAAPMARRLSVITQHLEQHPLLGRVGIVDGTRELIIADSPWVLVYAIDEVINEVVVLGVIDMRSDWR